MNKFEFVRKVIVDSGVQGGRLLDVGCRGCELKPYVSDLVIYTGLDLFQNSEGSVDVLHDLSNPLPMADSSFEFVVALDVVEHLDDFRAALEELLRMTARELIVILPNLAHLLFRKEFLLRGRIGGKYDLVYGAGQDRHRWFTVIPQTDDYMDHFAAEKHLELQRTWLNDTPKKELFARLLRLFMLPPSTWVWASAYVLRKARGYSLETGPSPSS